jgi:hypothetical protein
MSNNSINIEEYARDGKKVPHDATYRIRIDKDNYETALPSPTGEQILALAGKTSSTYHLYLHIKGGQTQAISGDKPVDLTEPGVERFSTMKIENTEG